MHKSSENFSSVSEIAQVICEEVKSNGVSMGWKNMDLKTFKCLTKRLENHHIKYGYLGVWKKEPTILQ